MAKDFKVGESVWLRSGGPEMTISKLPGDPTLSGKYHEIEDGDGYECTWFKGNTRQVARFRAGVLVRVQPAPAKTRR